MDARQATSWGRHENEARSPNELSRPQALPGTGACQLQVLRAMKSSSVFRLSSIVTGILLVPAIARAQTFPLDTLRANATPLDVFLSQAALVNAQIPDRLRAYRSRVETEMSLAIIDSGGRERTAQLEQIASDVRFRNPDRYNQRVVGYRNQSVGPTFS